MKKWLIGLLLVHVSLLGYSAVMHSPTPDELAHVAAGLSHWQLGDFSLYRVNPPLARMVATLPIILFESGQEEWLKLYLDPGDFGRTEFAVGNAFIELQQERIFWWLTQARIASSLFSLLGAVVCYWWAKELYGHPAGMLASVLWCFSPMVLGFGAIVTPDVPSAATGALALYAFSRWLRSSSWADAYLTGVSLGLAELTKSTWIILPPMFFVLWSAKTLGSWWLQRRSDEKPEDSRSPISSACQFAMLGAVGWLVFLGGYGFQGAFQRLGDYEFRSPTFVGQNQSPTQLTGNRFRGTWLEQLPLPLPRQFMLGLDYHKQDVEPGNKYAFLRGELRKEGWWYYYLYALGVKCTVGGLALFLIASIGRVIQRRWLKLEEWCIWLPLLAVLILLSYHTGLNKHSRYLLPIFPLAIVWSSQCMMLFMGGLSQNVTRLLAASAVVSSLSVFPHTMSYFNELAGGASQGRHHLSNSNVDWGQDLYFLKREMERRGWERIGMVSLTRLRPTMLGIDFFLPPVDPKISEALPESLELTNQRLLPGPYAISVCSLQGYPNPVINGSGDWGGGMQDAYKYFEEFEPIGMVGYSMLLYDLSEEHISRSKSWGSPSGK